MFAIARSGVGGNEFAIARSGVGGNEFAIAFSGVGCNEFAKAELTDINAVNVKIYLCCDERKE